MARTRAADYDERREAIVEKAAELFADKGFEGASISGLAAACNTSKSLIYHYYTSKEELLYAVMSSHIDDLLDAVNNLAIAQGKPAERMSALIHEFMSIYVGAAARQKVLLNDLRSLPDDRRSEIVLKQRSVISAMDRLLAGVQPALAKDKHRLRAATMLVFGMINWTSNWYRPKGPVSPDELATLATALILDGTKGYKDP